MPATVARMAASYRRSKRGYLIDNHEPCMGFGKMYQPLPQ